MTIERLQIPYDDFKLQEIMHPDEFDLNNKFFQDKINEIRKVVNQITDSIEDGGSGADIISLTPIEGFASDKLQTFLESVIATLRGSGGAEFIGSSTINGLNGNTVNTQLRSAKALLDNLNTQLENLSSRVTSAEQRLETHDHDNRYMTRAELVPYLQGGDTVVREDVFTIISSNNGDGTFTYRNRFDEVFTGELDDTGKQIFTLRFPFSQHVEGIIDDTLRRSENSGGLEVLSNQHIKLGDILVTGQEVTFKYYQRVGITGEHNIVYGEVTPPPSDGNMMWFKVVK